MMKRMRMMMFRLITPKGSESFFRSHHEKFSRSEIIVESSHERREKSN